ncbi:MAG: outer membrane lipoprotein carrier protein LolA [Planctomycetota bacterium]
MKRLILTAGILSALLPSLAAQNPASAKPAQVETKASAAAKPWLAKLQHLDAKSVEVDLTMAVNMAAMGMKVDMNGHLTFADEGHYRLDSKLKMSGDALPGEGGMEMTLLSVADGTTLWNQIENPMMGQQVMKLSLDFLKKHGMKIRSSNSGMGLGGGNPFNQVGDYAKMVDFSKVVEAGDSVKLKGSLSKDALAKNPQMEAQGITGVVLTLDKKTSYPLKVELQSADGPVISMAFSNYLFPKELDITKFTYQAPEGAMVQDLEEMLGMMGETGEDDDEF